MNVFRPCTQCEQITDTFVPRFVDSLNLIPVAMLSNLIATILSRNLQGYGKLNGILSF